MCKVNTNHVKCKRNRGFLVFLSFGKLHNTVRFGGKKYVLKQKRHSEQRFSLKKFGRYHFNKYIWGLIDNHFSLNFPNVIGVASWHAWEMLNTATADDMMRAFPLGRALISWVSGVAQVSFFCDLCCWFIAVARRFRVLWWLSSAVSQRFISRGAAL